MRRVRVTDIGKVLLLLLIAALALAPAPRAGAQATLTYDWTDWLSDRGDWWYGNAATPNPTQAAGNTIPAPYSFYRLGYDAFFSPTMMQAPTVPTTQVPNPANNPGLASRMWVWPRAEDLAFWDPASYAAGNEGNVLLDIQNNQLAAIVVDNPNSLDTTLNPRTNVPKALQTGTEAPSSAVTPAAFGATIPTNTQWSLSPNVVAGTVNQGTGFSLDGAPNNLWYEDYLYTLATGADLTKDFQVTTTVNGGTTTRPVTDEEFASLPNVDPAVYLAVDQTLQNPAEGALPFAQWTSGNMPFMVRNGFAASAANPQYYYVDFYSPGSGTLIPNAAGQLTTHPNIQRAFIRISWGANYLDPTTSRIYVISLDPGGWQRIHSSAAGYENGGLGPVLIPYDGTNQLTVTLYAITPDNVADTGTYLTPPLVTADAVTFTPAFVPIGPIYAPVVGAKLAVNNNNPGIVDPRYYFTCRQEPTQDTTLRSYPNPENPALAGTTPTVADPTASVAQPVFYCIDNEPNVQNGTTTIYTNNKVRWRFIGIADANGTATASPLLANVKCRDGATRSILYWSVTSTDGTTGHIYALDPSGGDNTGNLALPATSGVNLNFATTRCYWVYPSYRPPLATESTSLPFQIHDPNYTGYAVNANYPAITVADAAPAGDVIHYDGDIESFTGAPQVASLTALPTLEGFQSSPIVVSDPNANFPDMLIVGNDNGRVYAFDAGGRLDYAYNAWTPGIPTAGLTYNVPGTTQRLWTWPMPGADKWRFGMGPNLTTGTNSNGQITIVAQPAVPADDVAKGAFLSSPAFDVNFPKIVSGSNTPASPQSATAVQPIYMGSNDGHMYAVMDGHDASNGSYQNGEAFLWNRLFWYYPDTNPDSTTHIVPSLGMAVSTPAIFSAGGASPAGTGSLYFTSSGTVYSIPEAPAGYSASAAPFLNTTTNWTFPPLALINNANNAQPTIGPPNYTVALDATGDSTFGTGTFENAPPSGLGTVASSPVVVPQVIVAASNGGGAPAATSSYDLLYALTNAGTLLALDASGNATGTSFATTNSTGGNLTVGTNLLAAVSTGTSTHASPVAVDVTDSIYGTNASDGAIAFGDDSGNMWGFWLNPTTPSNAFPAVPVYLYDVNAVYPPLTTTVTPSYSIFSIPASTLVPIWQPPDYLAGTPAYNTGASTLATDVGRYAACAQEGWSNDAQTDLTGTIVEGDASGILRAYAGATDTSGEPPGAGAFGGAPGPVTVDMRVLDIYKEADYNLMNLSQGAAQTESPGINTSGQPYNTNVAPFPTNITGVTNAGGSTTATVIEWGQHLFAVAWGVYYANPASTTPPTVMVQFQLMQGGKWQNVNATAQPAANPPQGTVTTNGLWPADLALITGGQAANLSIYGVPPGGGARQQFTGTTQGVFPWVAKAPIKIVPTPAQNSSGGRSQNTLILTLAPGGGYTIRAKATITQSGTLTNTSRILLLGQRDPNGDSTWPPVLDQFQIDGLGSRGLYIANPIAVTVRGYPDQLNGSSQLITDMTSAAQLNALGWGNDVSTMSNPFEVLGNGNRSPSAGTLATGLATSITSVFAPVGMIKHGTSQTYVALGRDSARSLDALLPAFFIADRSDWQIIYPAAGSHSAGTGTPLTVRIYPSALNWVGDASNVLNILPWDAPPGQSTASLDYPGIGSSAIGVQLNGVDAISGSAPLASPTFNYNGSSGTDPSIGRIATPTMAALTVSVPQFQPANVNRGAVTFGGHTFGSTYTSIALPQNILGQTSANQIVGPLDMRPTAAGGNGTGGPVRININSLATSAYPSGGYIGEMIIVPNPPGGRAVTSALPVQQYQADSSQALPDPNGLSTYRAVELGIAVPPDFKMRVQEETLDLGKVPVGAGYSPLPAAPASPPTGSSPYTLPFEPTGMGTWANGGTPMVSPWDDPRAVGGTLPFYGSTGNLTYFLPPPVSLGEFFIPFTLVNEGNVNLLDVRVAKLTGVPGAGTGLPSLSNNSPLANNNFTVSSRLTSDQVDTDTIANLPLFALPFSISGSQGVGSIGIVSSFDHPTSINNGLFDQPLWPFAVGSGAFGTYAYLSAIQSVVSANGILQTPPGLSWSSTSIPAPTVHKPRVGDVNGTTATIPDHPHDLSASDTSPYRQPEVGVAVPPGTPSGTWSVPLYVFEDSMPIQWREWLYNSQPANQANLPTDHNGSLDIAGAVGSSLVPGAPLEPYSNPYPTLKLTVTEARLTSGATPGSLSQIDADPKALVAAGETQPIVPSVVTPLGGGAGSVLSPVDQNMLPCAFRDVTAANASPLYPSGFYPINLWWTSNRQYPSSAPTASTDPSAYNSYQLFQSVLPAIGTQVTGVASNAVPVQFEDYGFATSTSNPAGSLWWTKPAPEPGALTGPPFVNDALLFPWLASQVSAQTGPFLAGTPVDPATNSTESHASPAVAQAVNTTTPNHTIIPDPETYLFWQGRVDKARPNGQTVTDSRTFWVQLAHSSSTGRMDPTGAPNTILNDPALTKLSPHPLLLKLGPDLNAPAQQKFLYLFWHAGNQFQTALYYKLNYSTDLADPLTNTTWGPDTKLPTPGSLAWQSDPYPVYHHFNANNGVTPARDPVSGTYFSDAIDVCYTGVLKNRKTIEVLLTRYGIVRSPITLPSGATYAIGQLVQVTLPAVQREPMQQNGNASTFSARDADWFSSSAASTTAPQTSSPGLTVSNPLIESYNPATNAYTPLNPEINAAGTIVTDPNTGLTIPDPGRYDPASGLIYYNSTLGGQMILDTRSGTVSFPNVAPAQNLAVVASYWPQTLRLNASRESNNLDFSTQAEYNANYVTFGAGDPGMKLTTFTTAPGGNANPVPIADHSLNPRAQFVSPVVVSDVAVTNGQPSPTAMTVDRLWVFYRKTDPTGATTTGIYYKAMRPLIRLPRPVLLVPNNTTGLNRSSPLRADTLRLQATSARMRSTGHAAGSTSRMPISATSSRSTTPTSGTHRAETQRRNIPAT